MPMSCGSIRAEELVSERTSCAQALGRRDMVEVLTTSSGGAD